VIVRSTRYADGGVATGGSFSATISAAAWSVSGREKELPRAVAADEVAGADWHRTARADEASSRRLLVPVGVVDLLEVVEVEQYRESGVLGPGGVRGHPLEGVRTARRLGRR